MLKLMRPTPPLSPSHPLRSYEYRDSDRWSAQEMESFYHSLYEHNKDFPTIARLVGSKSARQCVQFYYLWKRFCPEEYSKLRLRHASLATKHDSGVSLADSKETRELREAIASVADFDFSEGKSILQRTLVRLSIPELF